MFGYDGQRYSGGAAAKDRAAWQIVVRHAPGKSEKQAREIIKTWIRNKVLTEEEYFDPIARKPALGLELDPAKRPG